MSITDLQPQEHSGRPTLANKEVAAKIIRYMAQGNYLKPSCEAAGVSYSAMREWIAKAGRDKEAGITSPYTEFTDRLAQAESAGEQALVERLNVSEDWRAQAFILERRHRDRWGKTEQQQQPQQVLVISEELAAGMLEALRVAAAPQRQLPNAIDAEVTELPSSSSSETD